MRGEGSKSENAGDVYNLDEHRQGDTSLCASLGLGSETGETDSHSTLNYSSFNFSSCDIVTQETKKDDNSIDKQEQRISVFPTPSPEECPSTTPLGAARHDPSHSHASEMESFLGEQQVLLSPIAMSRESFDSICMPAFDTIATCARHPTEEYEWERPPTQESISPQSLSNAEPLHRYDLSSNHAGEMYMQNCATASEYMRNGMCTPDHGSLPTIETSDNSSSPRPLKSDKTPNSSPEHDEQLHKEASLGVLVDQASFELEKVKISDCTDSAHITAEVSLSIGETVKTMASNIKARITEATITDHENDIALQVKFEIVQAPDAARIPNRTSESVDLTRAKEHIDASSLIFIESLRGAAHRRKLEVTRSRDSLAAKEKQQLLAIAESRERERQTLADVEEMRILRRSLASTHKKDTAYKAFKARPMIPSGSGGQVGIPKVAKKPTTIPFSPQLGTKRLRRPRVRALEKSHGGQFGVPKVEKRNATVPLSPNWGVCRPAPLMSLSNSQPATYGVDVNVKSSRRNTAGRSISGIAANHLALIDRRGGKEKVADLVSLSPCLNTSLSSIESSADLRGLGLLSTKTSPPNRLLSIQAGEATTPVNVSSQYDKIYAFVPCSTQRAKKRADFDFRRKENESSNVDLTKLARTSLLVEKRDEVIKLREILRQLA